MYKFTSYRLTTIVAALSGLAVVLLLRRTPGIEHDSLLYFAQGLLHLYPERFSQDLFFLHGGQDRYTIFPWLMGQAFRWVDPLFIFMLGALVGLLFFTFASWYCLKKLLPTNQRYAAWMGVLCLPTMYGYVKVFSYSEPFFTMRPYAEALCLLAIVFVIRERWIAVVFCLIIAGLLHPLQTLMVLPAIWLWLVINNSRRWLHALWLIVPISILALAEVRPLNGLFEQADPFWLMSMRLNPHLFINHWNNEEFVYLAWDIFILVLAWQYFSSSPFGRWVRVSLISLSLGLISNLILVDWLHLVLPTGLQLWRTHWLAHWFAMASLALFFLEHWNAKQWSQAILLILAGLLVWCENNWIWLVLAAVYFSWPRLISDTRLQRLTALLSKFFVLGLCLLLIKYISEWKYFSHITGYQFVPKVGMDLYLRNLPSILFGLCLFVLSFLGIYLWNKSIKHKFYLFFLVLLPALIWGGSRWDMRSDMRRYSIDNLAGQSDIFGVHIPENAQIFWDIDIPTITWYILNRAHYYSYVQLSGQVFSRATAVEGYDRWLRLKDMDKELNACQDDTLSVEQRRACHISDAALYKVCSPSLPPDEYPPPFPAPPDYIVLPFAQPQTALGQWENTYYLYSCADLMEELKIKGLPNKEEELQDT